MSKFSATTTTKPARVVTLAADGFADTWDQKPGGDVAIGLRLVSESDVQAARADAARQVIAWYRDLETECTDAVARDEAFNDALVRFIVARGTCDPNDASRPYFELAEETVRIAMTSEGVRRLWDEIVKLHIGSSCNMAPIEDDEAAELARLLSAGAIASLPESERAEVRKLLAYCLEQILASRGDETDEADGGPVYVARVA